MAVIDEARRKDEEASLVVYYTGHGAVGPKDLSLQTAGQVKVGYGQGVKSLEITVQARQTTDGKGFEGELVLILDACYSGKGAVSQSLTLGDLGKQTTILTSSAEIQESFSLNHPEYPKMSAFTYALLQGMEGTGRRPTGMATEFSDGKNLKCMRPDNYWSCMNEKPCLNP